MFRCLADLAGPFYDADTPFRNQAPFPYSQLDIPRPPYVDRPQLTRGLARAQEHLAQLRAQGYTGVVIDNLPHLVMLDRAPGPIYTPEEPHRARAAIYRDAFRKLFARAQELGMESFVTCDMQWSTPAVRRFVGRMAADNSRLRAVNRAALEELFRELPQVRGVIVRVGEAGGARNQGGAYSRHTIYSDVRSLRTLIDTLLPVCERHGKLLVVRTWSVGIGELGDLMWSPARYQAAFGGYSSPNLIVSVQHGPSDFSRRLPHNPTIGLPGPAQIVELQNRREDELFGMASSGEERFAGVWATDGSDGWGDGRAVRRLRAGPVLGGQRATFYVSAGIAAALVSGLLAGPVRRRALKVAAPFLGWWLFLLLSIFFEAGPSFME
jgi:hypothetical protein